MNFSGDTKIVTLAGKYCESGDILIKDIFKAIEFSKEHQKICTFRLNAYSDIKWEFIKVTYNNKIYKNIFELFSEYTFYDYTKISNRITPKNYQLTYSYYGNNKYFKDVLKTDQNIAIVFDKLPKIVAPSTAESTLSLSPILYFPVNSIMPSCSSDIPNSRSESNIPFDSTPLISDFLRLVLVPGI